MPPPLNVILLGDPAAGKATQARRIVKKYNLLDFDMGQELRKSRNRKRFEYKKTAAVGNLTATRFARQILREVIHGTPPSRGILFDGHPKMLGEAKIVATLLKKTRRRDPLFIYLSIPKKETEKRVSKRGRPDDRPFALKNRALYYRKHLSRVVPFFRARYPHENISGLGTRDEVWKRIQNSIENFRRSKRI